MKIGNAIRIALLLALVAAGIFSILKKTYQSVSSFEECIAKGNAIMESYPRQCRDSRGNMFRENIGNELEKDNLIRIASPRPNDKIKSPVEIRGVARGYWFFEANFPIFVVDWDGRIIGQGNATANSDPANGGVNWMTEDFVPFTASVQFDISQISEQPAISSGRYSKNGSLILKKDNPSGLPENEDALEIPVMFE